MENEHHQSVDGLLNLFSKANRDLSTVYNKLQREFQQLYPDNSNPMKLVARLKKIEDEMSSLKDQCRELLAAKQDLIDKARTILVGNRTTLQRLQGSTGLPVSSNDDDPAYENFNQVIDEWAVHVKSKTGNLLARYVPFVDTWGGDSSEEPEPDDINHLLFSAIVQGN